MVFPPDQLKSILQCVVDTKISFKWASSGVRNGLIITIQRSAQANLTCWEAEVSSLEETIPLTLCTLFNMLFLWRYKTGEYMLFYFSSIFLKTCGPLWAQQCGSQYYATGVCSEISPSFQILRSFSPALQSKAMQAKWLINLLINQSQDRFHIENA